MHELSIAHSLVSLVQEHVPESAVRVTAVHLRLGVLAGVVSGALEFCYGMATEGTVLQGSTLRIHELAVVIHCSVCEANRMLETELVLRCPVCGAATADIRQGRELELASIEYDDPEDVDP